MEDDGEGPTLFWLQGSTNHRRVRSGLSSLFLSSRVLVILLLVTAVCFLVFVVPSTSSVSAQIFRPNIVKKSWNSLTIVLVVLVLFAIVFGFLSRIKKEDRKNYDDYHQTSSITRNESQKSNPLALQQRLYDYSPVEAQKSNPSAPHQSYESDQRRAYNNSSISSRGGLRRNSRSFPDLLEASSQSMPDDDSWRFYDDMKVDAYTVPETGQLLHRRRIWKDKVDASEDLKSKNVYVDALLRPPNEASYTTKPPSPPPAANSPSPPPLLLPVSQPLRKERPKRVHQSVAHKRERRSKRKDDELEHKEPSSLLVTLPIPPPPPPLPRFVDQKTSKSDKKRTGASATKDFLHSLYHKKKKKQRRKSIEDFDALLHQSQTPPLHFQLPHQSVEHKSGSPDRDDVESDGMPMAAGGGDATLFGPSSLFCPSPDVDTEAENFITSFRAGLQLEKVNSIKDGQELDMSNMGRGSDPTQL